MENVETKICLFCGEEIKLKAVKCKYCQSNLAEGYSEKKTTDEPQSLDSHSFKEKQFEKKDNSRTIERAKETYPLINDKSGIEIKSSTLTTILIVISSFAGFIGLLFLTEATAGVGMIALGCLFGIFARLYQSHEQHKRYNKKKAIIIIDKYYWIILCWCEI